MMPVRSSPDRHYHFTQHRLAIVLIVDEESGIILGPSGRLAQLVERHVYTVDVGGSNPSPPTTQVHKERFGEVGPSLYPFGMKPLATIICLTISLFVGSTAVS
jgi:hypothetical protein